LLKPFRKQYLTKQEKAPNNRKKNIYCKINQKIGGAPDSRPWGSVKNSFQDYAEENQGIENRPPDNRPFIVLGEIHYITG
jgi:hypothetical protein